MSDTLGFKEKFTRYLQEEGLVDCKEKDKDFNNNSKVVVGKSSNGQLDQVNVGLKTCSNGVEYAKILIKANGTNHLVTATSDKFLSVVPFNTSESFLLAQPHWSAKFNFTKLAVDSPRHDLRNRILAAGEHALKTGITTSNNPMNELESAGRDAVCAIYAKPGMKPVVGCTAK